MKNLAFSLTALLCLAASLTLLAPGPAEGGQNAGKKSGKKTEKKASKNAKEASAGKKPQKMSLKEKVAAGRSLYMANGCADCHYIESAAPDSGCVDGEPLDGIGARRSREFVEEHLADPEEHVSKNYKVFSSEPNMMPHPNLSKEEVGLITDYLFSLPEIKAEKQ
ncbi:MAG: c-type cytochrome [Candidatus Obscuribacterales bacterium]